MYYRMETPSGESFFQKAIDYVSGHIADLLIAAVILVVGYFLVKFLTRLTVRALEMSKIPVNAQGMLLAVIKILLYTLFLFMAASALGLDVTGAVAITSMASLGVSLAVQDLLKNFIGGLQLLSTKPFKIGDYVTVGDHEGIVKDIDMFYTYLTMYDNKHVYIPNSQMANAVIMNYTAENELRLDLVFSIGYDDDFEKAKAVIEKVIADNPLAIHPEKATVRMCAHSASSVDIAVKVWVEKQNYWDLNYDMYEKVKAAFDTAGITIPYPQVTVNTPKENRK